MLCVHTMNSRARLVLHFAPVGREALPGYHRDQWPYPAGTYGRKMGLESGSCGSEGGGSRSCVPL